ncbi:MAG: cysteine desulfurase [Firmicutes bacterium]|nr:cysteine desulfurase [Bacillota bacterium]
MSVDDIRKDFPVLNQTINGRKLIYLDNAATTQKPNTVIKSIENYYKSFNGNPHRGAHYLSLKSTEIYETGRKKVANFINASSTREVIFTRNATESLNLLAYSYGMNFIEEGDEIVISIMEHHSNLIPWQRVAKSKKAVLKYLYTNEEGIITEEEIKKKITDKTKLVSIAHVSNALGTINPIKFIIDYAHSRDAKVILDAAQSLPHMKVNVKNLDVDFLVFSGHKMLAPLGIGVLYGKENLLEKIPPFLYGGDMIEYVYEDSTTFAELPHKLEAGTQNVAGVLGLTKAIDYLNEIGMDNIEEMESELTSYALEKLDSLSEIELYGFKGISNRGSVISFNVKDVHPHDTASILDAYGVAIRAGHHCAQPLMRYLGINATCRASFYFYNTEEEIDLFIESLKNVRKWLGYES